MHKRRVAVTGIGAVSPFGWGLGPLLEGVEQNRSALSVLAGADSIPGMLVKVGGKAPVFNEKSIPREYRRSMSRMGVMGFVAACEALENAGIRPDTPLASEYRDMGICISSTTVSPNTMEDFFRTYFSDAGMDTVRSTVFFKVMGHAVPSNIAVSFGLTGRCLAPAGACATSIQAIGLAYESIAFGRAEMMLAGGVEEFHPLLPATFDRIGAASHCPDPGQASRPFDITRDGIVCSEGAGIFLLEEYERAQSRGARIIAELSGFGTGTSPTSIVFPDSSAIGRCISDALRDAGLRPEEIGLVSAHATATEAGDIAEAAALAEIFGGKTPVNSLKGCLGHCMAASGALELAAAIDAAKKGYAHGTRNLQEPDPRCQGINILQKPAEITAEYLLKNNFGLGGVNASLVIKL